MASSKSYDASSLVPFPGTKNLYVEFTHDDSIDLLIDATTNFGPSATGKSNIIASTVGNRPIGKTGATIGLNCYQKTGSRAVTPQILADAFKTEFKRDLKGVALSLENDRWVRCRVNLKERMGPSSSGTTTILATTSGNLQFGKSGVFLGLNCYCKKDVDLSLLRTVVDAGSQHRNIDISSRGGSIHIEVPLTTPLQKSATGKKFIVAATNSPSGWPLPDLKCNANVIVMTTADKPVYKAFASTAIAEGITASIEADILKLDCNLGEGKPSSTGATVLFANSGGCKPIPNTNMSVTLNVRCKASKSEEKSSEDGDANESDAGGDQSSPKAKAKTTNDSGKAPSQSVVTAKVSEIMKRYDDPFSVSLKEVCKAVAEELGYKGEPRDLLRFTKRAVEEVHVTSDS